MSRYLSADERAALHTALGEAKGRLEQRLQRGDDELRAAEARGERRPDWDALWLRLLARYEAVCDALAELERMPAAAVRAEAGAYAA
ncbi:MAG: hypothetical protein HY691_03745 [Chloroflexi bacterium]|nr:hypothetical protein [Chloroflexota bacterium]